MKYLNSFLAIALVAVLAACGAQKYTVKDFDSRTMDHQTVAVLPVEMVFTGKQPKDLTPEDIATIEDAESQAFQISLLNSLLGKANKMRVTFQDYNRTNQRLEDAGIGIRESWTLDPEELAQVLGVDAVVRMRVEKQRYMSDLASFGIDMAQNLVWLLSDFTIYPWLPGSLNKTNDIRSRATLLDGKDGSVLWNVAVTREADWNRPSEEIINGVTRKYARNFPYR